MATTVARLEAYLTAHTGDFEKGMDRAERRMHTVRRTAGIAGAAIVGGLAVALEKSVKAAMDAQTSQVRLEQAFRRSGISAAAHAKEVDKLERSGRKLGFTDEQTKNALGSLLIATHNMRKASSDLAVAQDVARFKHVDLTTATKMLTMAQAGSQRATKQLGIDVPRVTTAQDALKRSGENLTTVQGKLDLAHAKLIDKQRTAAAVIDTVKQKLGGQADAYSKTAAGGMEQFHAQLDHLEVKMGTGLLPIISKVVGALSGLMDFFSKHTTTTKVLATAIGAFGIALLTVSVYAKVATAATKLYAAAQWLLNAAMDANPITLVITALVLLGVGVVVAYKKFKPFRDAVNEAWGILKETFNWVKQNWPLLVGLLGGPVGLAVEQIIAHRNKIANAFKALPGMIGNAITGIRDMVFNRVINPFTGAIGDGAKAVKAAVTGLFGKVIGWVEHVLGRHSPSAVFFDIGQDVVRGFINGVGSMSGLLKSAVVGIAKDAIGHLNPLGGGTRIAPGKQPGGGTGNTGGYRATPQQAESFAFQMLPRFGWGSGQFAALRDLWTGESGWSWSARNRSSGAYGIPQALPASKMSSAGPDWKNNAFTQIMWGLNYIKGRYGSPENAYSAWQSRSPHWYDQGGWLPQGLSLAVNNTGRPERVLGPGESGGTFNFFFPGYVGDESVVTAAVRDAMEMFQNRNGRAAFGSGF